MIEIWGGIVLRRGKIVLLGSDIYMQNDKNFGSSGLLV